MQAFVFYTKNNNYYLYSPVQKRFHVIPHETYLAIKSGNIASNLLAKSFYDFGYLDELTPNYNHKVCADDIIISLANVPQIVFEVTTNCNLACKYCCYGDCYNTFSNRKAGSLKIDYAKFLLNYISELCHSVNNTNVSTPLVLSFYGGEPLLNFALIEDIINYAKTLSFPGRFLKFSLTTNATLLSKHIDFLYENDFSLLVSLDGDKNNNSYRKFKNGEETFESIIENLNFVKLKYPDYFKKIRFNSVFTNLSDTNQLFTFFTKKFDRIPTLSPLHADDSDQVFESLHKMRKNINMPSSEWYDLYPDSFLEVPIHKKIVQILMYMSDSLHYNEHTFIESFNTKSTFPTHTCIPFSKRLFLTFDGYIIPCEKVNRDNPLGYITNNKVDINFEAIADFFNKTVEKYKAQCAQCALQQICNHCAFTASLQSACPEFKFQDSISNVLGDVFSYIEDNPQVLKKIYDNIILR